VTYHEDSCAHHLYLGSPLCHHRAGANRSPHRNHSKSSRPSTDCWLLLHNQTYRQQSSSICIQCTTVYFQYFFNHIYDKLCLVYKAEPLANAADVLYACLLSHSTSGFYPYTWWGQLAPSEKWGETGDQNSPHFYLRQGGYVFARLFLFVCSFVCLSVCQQDNSKSYGWIFLKF